MKISSIQERTFQEFYKKSRRIKIERGWNEIRKNLSVLVNFFLEIEDTTKYTGEGYTVNEYILDNLSTNFIKIIILRILN